MSKKLLGLALLFGPALCMAAGSLTTPYGYYWWDDVTAAANSYGYRVYTCPAAYPHVVSGNCGHRDPNVPAQTDVVVNYTGTAVASGYQATAWRCLFTNNNLSTSRTLRVGLICSK